MAEAIEFAIDDQFGDGAFVTAILAALDLDGGALSWVNAGHPPPLLLREHRVVKALEAPADRPLGLGLNARLPVHVEHLQPGDQILAYTDGVTEARDEHGDPFGLDRLADFVVRADAAGEPMAETMRRLSRSVLAYNHGQMRDDATHMLVGWLTAHPTRLLPEELGPDSDPQP
jgi:serine phosphatase RsbU (regulator of sigma subunit)